MDEVGALRAKLNESEKDMEVRRAKLKEAARLRAIFNYKMALKRVDYKLDVIEPSVEEIGAAVEQGQLPQFTGEAGDVRSPDA